MKRLMLVLVMVVFLMVGCSLNKVWVRPGGTQGQFQQDSAMCKAQARRSGQAFRYRYKGFYRVSALARRTRLVYSMCMMGLGYYLAEVEEYEDYDWEPE